MYVCRPMYVIFFRCNRRTSDNKHNKQNQNNVQHKAEKSKQKLFYFTDLYKQQIKKDFLWRLVEYTGSCYECERYKSESQRQFYHSCDICHSYDSFEANVHDPEIERIKEKPDLQGCICQPVEPVPHTCLPGSVLLPVHTVSVVKLLKYK